MLLGASAPEAKTRPELCLDLLRYSPGLDPCVWVGMKDTADLMWSQFSYNPPWRVRILSCESLWRQQGFVLALFVKVRSSLVWAAGSAAWLALSYTVSRIPAVLLILAFTPSTPREAH